MLEIENLTYVHAGNTPLYRYDLSIKPGEIVLVSGKSGAGKSTLLDLVAGFLAPNTGRIDFRGADLAPLLPEARPVSILFQEDNLFEHLSVRKNLALGLPKNLPSREMAGRIEIALNEVGLTGYGLRRASDLSGGQKQRVALARTLLRNKPILLLDEPFASLDEETASKMRALVLRLSKKHDWHTLVVSHSAKDRLEWADRTYDLVSGRLIPDNPTF
jgi:thiamine transport system ATP-binding protein